MPVFPDPAQEKLLPNQSAKELRKELCMKSTKFVVSCLIVVCAVALLIPAPSVAQDSKGQTVLPAPAPGKAIVCVYRPYRFTGSASHDDIFVNGTHLGRLLNDEYEFIEVAPGPVVIAGLPKMYYAGGVVVSSYTAISNASRKENERAHFDAEAGKTYYFKWTAGPMESGIKLTQEDAEKGAKEVRKLHLSKPPDDKEDAKAAEEAAKKEAAKPDAAKQPEQKTEPPKTDAQPQPKPPAAQPPQR